MARERLGTWDEPTIMIGDTMATDIRGATELELQFYLVLIGSTRAENMAHYPNQLTGILNSIADLVINNQPTDLPAALRPTA